jgi:para-nitrobenzyl esterase
MRRISVRKRWLFAAMVVAALQVASVAAARQAVTESGAISGVREHGLNVYKGIPFAAPPVGELRWRAPALVARWAGTRKADSFAPACMQDDRRTEQISFKE